MGSCYFLRNVGKLQRTGGERIGAIGKISLR